MINLIKTFSAFSGLKLNIEKSQLLWLGPWRIKRGNKHGIKEVTGCIDMLGVYVERDVMTKNQKKNFFEKKKQRR